MDFRRGFGHVEHLTMLELLRVTSRASPDTTSFFLIFVTVVVTETQTEIVANKFGDASQKISSSLIYFSFQKTYCCSYNNEQISRTIRVCTSVREYMKICRGTDRRYTK